MPERVAVIAVHGVGHHQPREAARATADLLVFSNPGAYAPFVEAPLRIPVMRVEPGSHAVEDTKFFEERPAFMAESVKASSDLAAKAKADSKARAKADPKAKVEEAPLPQVVPEQPEIDYMREQLSSYRPEGEDRVYDTVSLTSTRTEAGHETEVHVYDMYWTDLSRVSTTGLRLFGELYQLLFYVAGLGRHTLDFACVSRPHDEGWKYLAWLQKNAERLLVLWIPVLNLCGFGLAVVVIPQKIYALKSPWAIWATAAVLLVGFFLAIAIITRRFTPGGSWPWLFWISIVAGPAIALGVFAISEAMPIILAFAFWAVVAALIVLLMRVYNKRRPGATLAGAVSVMLTALMLACPIVRHQVGPDNIQELGLRAGWWLYVLLHILWMFFVAFAMLVSLVGLWAAYRPRATSEDKRAVWTANLSLTLPGLLVLVLNLGLWEGALKVSRTFLDEAATGRIRHILDLGTPWSLGPLLGLAILALLSVVWCLLPSIFGEVFPKLAAARPAAPLGVGLSQGFRFMRGSGEVVRLILVAGLPATLLLTDLRVIPAPVIAALAPWSQQSTFWVGLLLIAMIAGPGPLRALAMGLRTGIDVAIDVANWLRLHPREENPRARICARYASLLRNILDYRGRDGKGFDRIVIFSHSQGTVISSEMLRFLKANGDSLSTDLAARSFILFTMGCPLRQLYSQRFPIQYAWARHEDASWPGAKPGPAEIGVNTWVNAYRSGDYVGRHLWHPDDPRAWDTKVNTDSTHVEVCIGAGAHTHYWDDSAPEVARCLDELVAK